VAEPALFSEAEARFLRALTDEGVEFLVVGLSAAALQGAPAVTQDVDLWFRDLADPGIRTALKKVGGVYVASTGSTPPMLVGPAVALFDVVVTMHGLESFAKEAARAVTVVIDGIRVKVLPLERIIASKKATNRPKDRAILPVLEDAAKTIRARRQKRPKPRRGPRV
jgi:predicted nucleotidyltransferase